MEHSSLIATFSTLSLRQHFRPPFFAIETVVEASNVPPFSNGEYGLGYALPINSTATSPSTIATPYLSKLIGGGTILSPSLHSLDQTKVIILLMSWLFCFYCFYSRKSSRSTKRLPAPHRWPEHPFALIHNTTTGASHQCSHYSHHAAKLMASTHNTILRGLNAVYAQSFYVGPGTKSAADLLNYCSLVIDFLHHHHEVEELVFFPAISAAIGDSSFTEQNVAQHRAFESGLEAVHLYATATPPVCFSAYTLRQMLESFAPVLTQHLHDEIPSILSLHNKMPSAALRQIYSKMLTAAERESNPLM